MDFIMDLPLSIKSGAKILLVIIDRLSKGVILILILLNIHPRSGHGLYKALRSVPRVLEGDY